MKAVLNELEKSRSTLLVMPTGTGKTRVFAEVLKERKHLGRALVVAHREELIAQACAAIEQDTGLTTDVEQADSRAQVVSLVGVSDVVVASVPTLHERRRDRWPRDHFATIVVDEAHHATARTYRALMEHFTGARVLGVTATPDRSDGIGLGNVFDSSAFTYGMRDAIVDGWLCCIRQTSIYCADLDLSSVRSVRGDLHEGDLQQAMRVDSVLHQVADPLVKEAGERRTLVFTVGVQQAHALAEVLGAYTDPDLVDVVDGSTPKDVRRDILDRYQMGKIRFLVNVGVLTEGFDAPETSCIAMARPTKSRTLYAQCIGRGTRIFEGKKDLLVLDFVGNSGRHKLVDALDVLAGRPIPEDVRELAQRKVAEGLDLQEALSEAESEALEKRRKEEEARRRQRLRFDTSYTAVDTDPFSILGLGARGERGPRATENQVTLLETFGIAVEYLPSRSEASNMISTLIQRRKTGTCTFKQARLLAKFGLQTEIGFTQASDAITRLKQNRWKVDDGLWEDYGVRE